MDILRRRGRDRGSLAFTTGLWILAGGVVVVSLGFPFEARIAPLIFGGAAFVLLTVVLVKEVRADSPADQDVADTGELVALLWVAGCIIALLVLGFVIGLSLAMLVMLRVHLKEPWRQTIILTAAVMLLTWGVFGRLLDVALYQGALGLAV